MTCINYAWVDLTNLLELPTSLHKLLHSKMFCSEVKYISYLTLES